MRCVLAVPRALPWLELLLRLLLASVAASYGARDERPITYLFSAMFLSYPKDSGIGCFGVGEAVSAKTLARNGFLLACAVTLTISAFASRASSRTYERR